MWLLLVLCIGATTASMIQLRDKNFDDEDKVLLGHIKERMQGRPVEPMDFLSTLDPELEKNYLDTVEYFNNILEMKEDEDEVGTNETRRQAKRPVNNQQLEKKAVQNITSYDKRITFMGAVIPEGMAGRRQADSRFPNTPDVRNLKERTMEMMQHQIYATQYRMRDLQKIIDKHSGDINYRVAYLYCRLETLLAEMAVVYTVVHKGVAKLKAHIHMIYYTHMLKKNVDVTYIVERMIRIHTEYMDRNTIKYTVQMNKNTTQPLVTGDRWVDATSPADDDEATPAPGDGNASPPASQEDDYAAKGGESPP